MQRRRAHFRCLSCIYVKGKKGSREVDAHVTSRRRRVFKGLWSQTGHRQSGLCASCHLLKVKAFSLLLKVAKIILGYWDLKEKLVDMTTPHLNLNKTLQTSKKQPLVKWEFSKVVWMSHLTNSKVVQITFWLFDNGTSPALRRHWRWQSVM